MKSKLISLITCLLLVTGAVSAKEYEVDSAHSKVGFSVTHLQLSEVEGKFNDFTGKIIWEPKDLKSSKIFFKAKTNSIDTDNMKRDSHLKGSDFFDAAKYPELSFESTKIKRLGSERYSVSGKLTAHGVTRNIKVTVRMKGPVDLFGDGEMSLGFNTRFKINRISYGIGAGWKGGSDKVVGHDVFITVKGEAHE